MKEKYENPLITRYASDEMAHIFSDEVKFRTWRKLWIALAEAESELGLPISEQQLDELRAHAEDINYDVAEEREKQVRHDVMSHVYAYGVQCPSAKGIIHMGATSCYVGDNTDIMVMDEALKLVELKLANVISKLSSFALEYKDMPTLGFTHFQPAQLTTVGKRATLWIQDLLLDLEELKQVQSCIRLRGVKGTTGTQASFMTLFEGDSDKVAELERRVVAKLGYEKSYAVTGQTYPRKFDTRVINVLAQIASSAYKFSGDMRLLQNLKEMEEPFGAKQIGSDAQRENGGAVQIRTFSCVQPGYDCIYAVVRAHAGRLGEQTSRNSSGIFSYRRRIEYIYERNRRHGCISKGYRVSYQCRAALHGYRDAADGSGQARRR
jgi:adenylosuccinate lyase